RVRHRRRRYACPFAGRRSDGRRLAWTLLDLPYFLLNLLQALLRLGIGGARLLSVLLEPGEFRPALFEVSHHPRQAPTRVRLLPARRVETLRHLRQRRRTLGH